MKAQNQHRRTRFRLVGSRSPISDAIASPPTKPSTITNGPAKPSCSSSLLTDLSPSGTAPTGTGPSSEGERSLLAAAGLIFLGTHLVISAAFLAIQLSRSVLILAALASLLLWLGCRSAQRAAKHFSKN